MTTLARRIFMLQVAACGAAWAQASDLTDESDPTAVALGYKADTKKVDARKYTQHDASQTCANCHLYVGKATDPKGGCAVFPGKKVAGPGWCSAWVKRSG